MEVATRRREQEVWQACDDLWALHGDMKQVTGDGIRERLVSLGKSRGSPNEIYKYRKTWLSSRGLSISAHDLHANTNECDPITRAVRIVHEQLQDSTNSRILELTGDYEQQLLNKDQEIDKHKKSLDNVLAEYAEIEQKYAEASLKLKNIALQLTAEVDVRRAIERELQYEKSKYQSELLYAEKHLSELKEHFANELSRMNASMKEQQTSREKQLADVTARMKQMGYEYSENLMAVKTSLVNQEIIARQHEEKLYKIKNEMHELQQKLESSRKENRSLELRLSTILSEVAHKKVEAEVLNAEKKHTERKLQKAELKIARLRVSLEHKKC